MPYSKPVFHDVLQGILNVMKPMSIIDVGCGAGRFVMNYDIPVGCEVVGYDIDEGYKSWKNFKEAHSRYKEIIYKDFYEVVLHEEVSAELFIFGDILEHMPLSRVLDTINYCVYRCNAVYAVVPIDLQQGPVHSHMSERHISSPTLSDFARFNVIEYLRRPFYWDDGLKHMSMFFIKGFGIAKVSSNGK